MTDTSTPNDTSVIAQLKRLFDAMLCKEPLFKPANDRAALDFILLILAQTGGVMNGPQIIAAREAGQIVIEPFHPQLVQTSSVDVRLGPSYCTTRSDVPSRIMNPYDPDSIQESFSNAKTALTHEEWCRHTGHSPLSNIPPDAQIIVLHPGERILGHTMESIGIKYGGTSMMHAKSTIGRLAISVCYDAGWGDEGFVARWTMEIKNNNNDVSVPLVVGQPIAQMIFFSMQPSGQSYGTSGHYQTGTNVAEIIANWLPSRMLPRPLEIIDFTAE